MPNEFDPAAYLAGSATAESQPSFSTSQSFTGGSGEYRDVVFASLQDMGLPNHVSAAILGDIEQESSFKPRLSGDGGTSWGLLQVGRPMFSQFERDQAKKGNTPDTPQYVYDQVPFILNKYREQHPERWNEMIKADSADKALSIFRDTKDWGYGVEGNRKRYATEYQALLSGTKSPIGEQIRSQIAEAPKLAGKPTAEAVDTANFDPEKYLSEAAPSVTPAPTTTVFDPSAYLEGKPQPVEMPTPEASQIQKPTFLQGLGEGLKQTAEAIIPTSRKAVEEFGTVMAAPTNPVAFAELAGRAALADYAAADAAIKSGSPTSYETGKAIGVIAPQAVMLAAGLRSAGGVAAPSVRAEPLPPKSIPPPVQIPATSVRTIETPLSSTKNAVVEAHTVERGLPEIAQVAQRDFSSAWDAAAVAEQSNPMIADQLVKEVNTGGMALNDIQNAILLRRQIAAETEFDAALREINAQPTDPNAARLAQARLEDARNAVHESYQAAKSAGTETGRGLNARKMLADRDLNLARMEAIRRAANQGRQLTPDELKEVQALYDEMRNAKLGEVQALTPEEATQLRADYEQAKHEFDMMVYRDTLKNKSLPERLWNTGREILALPKALAASMDLSALRRQGGMIFMGHPIRSLRAFVGTLKANTKRGFALETQRLRERPNWQNGTYKRAGLELTQVQSPKLTRMEEMFMSRWADAIPLVAHSQRVYVAFLNRLRADSFDVLQKTLGRNGAVTPVQEKVLGNFINVFTGRGSLLGRENAVALMNDVFWAPRYVTSRFQALLGQPLLTAGRGIKGLGEAMTKEGLSVRALIAKEYARTMIGYGVMYGLIAGAAKQLVDFDPRSTDFGKIKFGNTRVDPLSGLSQATVFIGREASGQTKKLSTGNIVPIRGEGVPFKGDTGWDIGARFLRSKLAPVPGAIADVISGETYTGQPVTLLGEVASLTTPLSGRDVYDAIKDQGVPAGAALGLLSFLGDGVQTYSPRIYQPKNKKDVVYPLIK